MEEKIASILLAEFRQFRSEDALWKQKIGERVTTVEVQVKDLYGNGRDGRVTTVEKDVRILQRWRYYVLGAAAVVGIVASSAWELFIRRVH